MTPPRRPTFALFAALGAHGSVARRLRVAAVGAVLLVPAAAAMASAAGPRQGGTALYLPDLQTDIKSTGAAYAAPQGQEGLGDAIVDVQNLADSSTTLQLDLWPKSGTAPVTLRKGLGPLATLRLDLADVTEAEGGFYAGRIKASQALGGGAHLRWVSGAAVAYEAAPAARDMILPLIARTVYSHTTIVYAQNTDESEPTQITMTLYDRESGSILNEAAANVDAQETYNWDTAHTENTFGVSAIGTNAPTGGWLGHAWFQAGRPIAVLGYGDELSAQGSSANLGRPVSSAAPIQYLPLVRATDHGGSLIAIANAGQKAVNATIDYLGAPFSPAGAGQAFTQQFKIGPRGAVFVDLAGRERGSRPAPELPVAGGGFIGSATVRAAGPVLAVAQDEDLLAGKVDSVAAYNAFGPDDLGTEFVAPTVRKAKDYQSSVLYVHNPDYAPLDVTVELFNASGVAAGRATLQAAPGSLARLALKDVGEFPDGLGRARLVGSGPFTALAADVRDSRGKPDVASTSVFLRAEGENHVGGVGYLTEQGADLKVALQISGTWPGSTYSAEVRAGECGTATQVTHRLTDFTDGKSTTVLRNVSIQSLTATPHVIEITQTMVFPRRTTKDVSCGTVEPVPGAEIVDSTLAWPVRLAAGEPIATPTVGPTATVPTATPTGATAPPPTVTATATARATPATRRYAYLPLAYK
jgi:hypothetical protein